MRLLDDIHQFTLDFHHLVEVVERFLLLRLRSEGHSPIELVEVQTGQVDETKFKGPEYYDEAMNIRLNEAIERYVVNNGEWPTDEQRRDFIEKSVDFSQE